jgi:hypothetical protein
MRCIPPVTLARVRASFLLLACVAPFSLGAQSIQVMPSTQVAVAQAAHPIIEPHLAIDPTHPNRLLAIAYLQATPGLKFPAGQEDQTCAAFSSADSGATWTRHDFAVTWCADPWVAITPDGQAVATMVAKQADLAAQGTSGLVAFHSNDAGRTWDSLPIGLGRSHDHPTMSVDLSSGPRRGWIYLSSHRGRSADDGRYRYAVYMARSRNGGKSFDDPVYTIPNNLHNLAEMPVVLSDGTLFESYVDATYAADSGRGTPSELYLDRRRAWVMRSSDGGFTFATPLFVTDVCGPPPGYRLSAFAADVSRGEHDGRLYFACRAAGGGSIVVTHSRDRGESWSPVVRMQPTPRDSVTYPIPGLAVNDRGAVLVAWTGASGTAGDGCDRNLYASASTDGGTTFSPRVLVAACGGGGDYFGISAVSGGRFRLVWPETRDGVQQLRTAVLEVAPRH